MPPSDRSGVLKEPLTSDVRFMGEDMDEIPEDE